MHTAVALLPLVALADLAHALTGTFSQNLAFDGPNPSKVGFNLYEPGKVIANAPLAVLIHPCGGSAANAYRNWPDFLAYADKYGFPVIFPDSPWDGKCWDVGGNATLKHDAGGDSQGIVSMVKYVSKKYNSDVTRIFATGYSSGAMMTQVLMGAYPDVFAAGAEVAGVPFGCWADPRGTPGTWSNDCATGTVIKTGAQWAQMVTNAYPGYTGYRPKLQLYHGTDDSVINYANFGEAIKEWTSVFGISATPVSTTPNTPVAGYTKTVYGKGQLEAYSGAGMNHGISLLVDNVMTFYDIACPAGGANCFRRGSSPVTSSPSPTTSTPTTTPSTAPTTAPVTTAPTTAPTTTPTPTSASGADRWGQCGGINWTGPTTCKEGKCVKANDWYSQCQ